MRVTEHPEAAKMTALAKFLKGWFPLWETVNGKDRLVFLSPELIQRYKDLSEPFYSQGIWCEEPEYKKLHFPES